MNQQARPDVVTEPLLRRRVWAVLNVLQFGFTLVWTMFCILLALAVYAVGGGRRHLPLRMASRMWAPGLLRLAGARLRVEGLERVDWSQPCVLVANHASVIDICALFRAVPVPLYFLLKQEMTRVPFINWYAKAMGMVFISRDDRRAARHSLHRIAAQVRGGTTVCIFPEGTRSRSGVVGPFKPGAFQTAIEAGARVLPVAIQGAGAVLPPQGFFRVRPGTIRVCFGNPLPLHDADGPLDRQTLANQAREAVLAMLADVRR